MNRIEAAKVTGLSKEHISRIVNSPAFVPLLTQAIQNHNETLLRAKLRPKDRLEKELVDTIHSLALIRDHSGSQAMRLKACELLLNNWQGATAQKTGKKKRNKSALVPANEAASCLENKQS